MWFIETSLRYVEIFIDNFITNYGHPRIALTITKECYILLVFLSFFSVQRFFDVPEPIFAKFCHAMRHVLWICSYVPSKNLRGETPNFRQVADPESILSAPEFYNAREIGKSKIIESSVARLRRL